MCRGLSFPKRGILLIPGAHHGRLRCRPSPRYEQGWRRRDAAGQGGGRRTQGSPGSGAGGAGRRWPGWALPPALIDTGPGGGGSGGTAPLPPAAAAAPALCLPPRRDRDRERERAGGAARGMAGALGRGAAGWRMRSAAGGRKEKAPGAKPQPQPRHGKGAARRGGTGARGPRGAARGQLARDLCHPPGSSGHGEPLLLFPPAGAGRQELPAPKFRRDAPDVFYLPRRKERSSVHPRFGILL